MRVRINKDVATSSGLFRSGEVCDISEETAKSFLKAGYATPVLDWLREIAAKEGYEVVRKREEVKLTDLMQV